MACSSPRSRSNCSVACPPARGICTSRESPALRPSSSARGDSHTALRISLSAGSVCTTAERRRREVAAEAARAAEDPRPRPRPLLRALLRPKLFSVAVSVSPRVTRRPSLAATSCSSRDCPLPCAASSKECSEPSCCRKHAHAVTRRPCSCPCPSCCDALLLLSKYTCRMGLAPRRMQTALSGKRRSSPCSCRHTHPPNSSQCSRRALPNTSGAITCTPALVRIDVWNAE
mmetsp:Transcript_29180/g.66191  ORF Transcript_29180/g.66191 Transcript_29180/m.66191 type:complete len:230 (-) Transcript_29180:144-833(-)